MSQNGSDSDEIKRGLWVLDMSKIYCLYVWNLQRINKNFVKNRESNIFIITEKFEQYVKMITELYLQVSMLKQKSS